MPGGKGNKHLPGMYITLGGPALRAGAPRLARLVLMRGLKVERDQKGVKLRASRKARLFKS
jgi:hypothetical protein